jgi:hypothetical protein
MTSRRIFFFTASGTVGLYSLRYSFFPSISKYFIPAFLVYSRAHDGRWVETRTRPGLYWVKVPNVHFTPNFLQGATFMRASGAILAVKAGCCIALYFSAGK